MMLKKLEDWIENIVKNFKNYIIVFENKLDEKWEIKNIF